MARDSTASKKKNGDLREVGLIRKRWKGLATKSASGLLGGLASLSETGDRREVSPIPKSSIIMSKTGLVNCDQFYER